MRWRAILAGALAGLWVAGAVAQQVPPRPAPTARATAPAPAAPAPAAGAGTGDAAPAPARAEGLLVETVVPLRGPGGPWGAPVIDDASRRLFLPRGPAGLHVLSANDFKPVGEVPDTVGSGVVALDGDTLRGFSANTLADDAQGSVTVFDQRTLKVVGSVKLDGPQHMLFDVATRQLVVLGRDGTLSLVDPAKLTVSGTVALEGKRLVAMTTDRRGRVFVLQSDRNTVAVVDLVAKRVSAAWPIAPCRNAVAMLFEAATFRAVLACRGAAAVAGTVSTSPIPAVEPMAVVLDGHSGSAVGRLPVPNQVEAIVSDSQRRLVYLTSGIGAALIVLRQLDFNRFEPLETAGTRPAAAQGVVDLRSGRLILPWADYIVPLRGEVAAQRRYQTQGGALLVMKRGPLD